MYKLKVYCDWGMDFDFDVKVPTELWVDKIPITQANADIKRIILLLEPPEIYNLSQAVINGHGKTYHYLLTHSQNLLDQLSNSFLFEFGGCWVTDYKECNKEFGVSTVVGKKVMTEGHRLRHTLWNRQHEITQPKKFWLSETSGSLRNHGNPILGKYKSVMFNYQYHIAIENVKRDNWFTEKLIDCLYTKTVPIYWGCPNISKWFDVDGMIIVNNIDELIEATNSLDMGLYDSMLGSITKNYNISRGFIGAPDFSRLKLIITKILNNI